MGKRALDGGGGGGGGQVVVEKLRQEGTGWWERWGGGGEVVVEKLGQEGTGWWGGGGGGKVVVEKLGQEGTGWMEGGCRGGRGRRGLKWEGDEVGWRPRVCVRDISFFVVAVAGGGEWGGWTFICVLLCGHNVSSDHRPLPSVAQSHGAAAVVTEVSG